MRYTSIAVLIVGLAALAYSFLILQQAKDRGAAEFAEVERAAVAKYWPRVKRMADGFGMKNPVENPQNFGDVLLPVEKLLEGLSK